MDLGPHTVARLLAGRPSPLMGRLLADANRRDAAPVLLDTSGAELRADSDPVFVLSTEGEATDGHIVRQFWNLARGVDTGGPGIPVLWGHDFDRLLGQWRGLEIVNLDTGPALVGRAGLDPEGDEAQERRRQIRAGILNAVSIRWIPGKLTRRSELDATDRWFRDAREDDCGQPAEGFVMGDEREPNEAIEGSLVSVPADQRAVVTQRLYDGASRAVQAIQRGGIAEPSDFERLLSVLAHDARARAYLAAEIARAVDASRADVERAIESRLRAELTASVQSEVARATAPPPPQPVPDLPTSPPTEARTVAHLFRKGA